MHHGGLGKTVGKERPVCAAMTIHCGHYALGLDQELGREGHFGRNFVQNLNRWVKQIADRPAVRRGIRDLGFGDNAVKERHSKADRA